MLTIQTKREPFTFMVGGSDTIYEIPYPQHLPVAYINRLRRLHGKPEEETAVAIADLFCDVLDAYAPGATEVLDSIAMSELLGHWGKELGELPPRP